TSSPSIQTRAERPERIAGGMRHAARVWECASILNQLASPTTPANAFDRIAIFPTPLVIGRSSAAISGFTTSGKQQLMNQACGRTALTARAPSIESGACSTAVALKPPSATSLVQALSGALITLPVWN